MSKEIYLNPSINTRITNNSYLSHSIKDSFPRIVKGKSISVLARAN